MKRILDSGGKQSKITFDIQLDQQKYYFRGDVVQGRIFLESPKPIKVKNIRVQWFGRVRVQLEPTLRDERELFKETAYLDLPETENSLEAARREAVKSAAMTLTGLFLVPTSPSKTAHYVEADKLYTYPFSFVIPQNTILPSCTESETNVGGIIEYIIEACLERPASEFSSSIKTRISVPILQRIDTTRPEQMIPQSAQVECRSSSRGGITRGEGIAILTATIQKKAFIRNQSVAVTVEINHFEPFKRKQSLTIALVRTCRLICKGASYILPDSVVHSVKADIDLTSENNLTQTVVRSILIPRHISPTIGINAQLFEIGYKIRVRAQLQQGGIGTGNCNISTISFPTDIQSLALLNAEIPIEIGTLPIPDTHVPPVPLKPQFIDYLNPPSSSSTKETTELQEDKNSLTPTAAEKIHMLKKMQNMMMLRRSSAPQIVDSSILKPQLDSTEQNMPMSKNDLLTLFEEASNQKEKGSLKSNNSDESGITTSTGAHSSISTFISSTSEQSQKAIFPPPPTSSPPTIQQLYNQSSSSLTHKNASSSIHPSFRLSLGPEFSTTILNSVLTEKPQQIEQEPTTIKHTASTNNNMPILINPTIYKDQQHMHHEQRRRINSDSIVLDAPHRHDNITESTSSHQKPDELTSSKSSEKEQSGVHYFYMFPESSSSEEEENQKEKRKRAERRKRKSIRKQQGCCATTTTAAGFEKPNSVSGVDVNEVRIERLKIVRQNNNKAPSSSNTPYPVTHVDKPDEVTASDNDMSLSSDEDLLDVLQRRDQKIASRMSRQ